MEFTHWFLSDQLEALAWVIKAFDVSVKDIRLSTLPDKQIIVHLDNKEYFRLFPKVEDSTQFQGNLGTDYTILLKGVVFTTYKHKKIRSLK